MIRRWISEVPPKMVKFSDVVPGATALARARAAGVFTMTHQGYWDAARRRHGDAAGTRALIEVLLAHRTRPAAAGSRAHSIKTNAPPGQTGGASWSNAERASGSDPGQHLAGGSRMDALGLGQVCLRAGLREAVQAGLRFVGGDPTGS